MSAEKFVPSADELLDANQTFAREFSAADLAVAPTRQLAIVTCMDSRMDIFLMLGLHNGEAHVIRNAGGVITDDVVRSLCLSQRFMGTEEIILIHHTDCGLEKVDELEFRADLQDEVGVRPEWSVEAFSDPVADVRQSIERLHVSPFVTHKDFIRGFVYDVTCGSLVEVERDPTS